MREAIGLCFDFDWTNKNIMYSAYKRIISYFPNTDMEAKGKPGPDEAQAARAVPRQARARRLRRALRARRRAMAQGRDRKLLKQAYDLLLAAGCKRDGSAMMLPNGKPLTIEFLDSNGALQPHTLPFIQNLGKLGIQATYRIVDPAQYKSRTDAFDFDVVTTASGGTLTPGVDLRTVFTSESAKQNASRNLAGVSDPVVDALVEAIATAKSRDELNAARPSARPDACAPAIIGFRCGIATRPGSPIGTRFPAPRSSRGWAPARREPGGGTKRRRKPLDSDRRLPLRPQVG